MPTTMVWWFAMAESICNKWYVMSFHFSDILLDYQAFAVKGGALWAVCIMGSECVIMGSKAVGMSVRVLLYEMLCF